MMWPLIFKVLNSVFPPVALNMKEHAHVNSGTKELKHVESNARVTFIMAGQTTEHEHIATNAQKKAIGWEKTERVRERDGAHTLSMHANGWPVLARANKRLSID